MQQSFTMQPIANIRRDYKLQSLNEADVETNALEQFTKWWNEAINSNIDEVNAMTLATVAANGKPSARIVLLKGYEENGFIFFTNYQSRKGEDIAANKNAALLFFWKELERQVRIEGIVSKISDEDSDKYFNSRPLQSRIGAWASPQSKVIKDRTVLDENFKKYTEKFSTDNIKRPPHWGGYIVKPTLIEFWQGRPSRLHDRIVYSLQKDGCWKIERVAP